MGHLVGGVVSLGMLVALMLSYFKPGFFSRR